MGKIRFNIQQLSLSGDWDNELNILNIEQAEGMVSVYGDIFGKKVEISGDIDLSLNNTIRIKIRSIWGLPLFFNAWILKLLKIFHPKTGDGLIIEKDSIYCDPNRLFPPGSNIRVMINPDNEELSQMLI